MRKILFVANVAKEHINKFHLQTIKKLKENGWQVDVICEADAKIPFCDHQFSAKWKRSPFTFKTFEGICQLKKILDNEFYDIIYSHTPVGGFVARIAASKARKKGAILIYFAHGFHFFTGCPIQNWVFYPIEKILSYKTDAMFLLNDEDYQCAKSKFNSKLFLKQFSGIGVDFNRISVTNPLKVREEYRSDLKIGQDDLVLIYIAEIIKNKNQIYLLNSLKEVLKYKKNTRLILVGPDHSDGKCFKHANEIGLGNNVIFTGWRDDIGELLCTADICVASSIREGFGINLVEAMYHGLPVVAVNNRGHATIIKNGVNGFLVPLNNYKKMSEKILQLVEDKEIYKKFSNLDVSKYDAKVVARDIVATIEKIGLENKNGKKKE